jgi:hypothetical protein
MTTPTEDEARAAAREAMALHLWDEGLVRPEHLAFAVVDEFIKEGWVSWVSTSRSERRIQQAQWEDQLRREAPTLTQDEREDG